MFQNSKLVVLSVAFIFMSCDKKVNLIDFSIVAFWYKKNGAPQQFDFNNDGKVTIVDFSIMAYYWTG